MKNGNSNKKSIFLYVLVLLVVLLVGSFAYQKLKGSGFDSLKETSESESSSSAASEEVSEDGEEGVIDFVMEGTVGNEVRYSDLSDKPTVINFWASWCPPCRAEMPSFQAAYEKYKDKINFVMLNATDGLQETKESAQDYLKNKDFTFPVYYDSQLEGNRLFKIAAYPTTILIKDGKPVQRISGMVEEGDLDSALAQLIDEGGEK